MQIADGNEGSVIAAATMAETPIRAPSLNLVVFPASPFSTTTAPAPSSASSRPIV